MDCMRWSEETTNDQQGNGNGGQQGGGAVGVSGHQHNQHSHHHQQAAPTIKNHSVTYFNGYLYCFGGYDGRRNHMTLLLYSIAERRWIRPSTAMVQSAPPQMQMQQPVVVATAPRPVAQPQPPAPVPAVSPQQQQQQQQQGNNSSNNNPVAAIPGGAGPAGPGVVAAAAAPPPPLPQPLPGNAPFDPNRDLQAAAAAHAAAAGGGGGGGGDPNVIVLGTPPPGRNGHSATLACDDDDDDDLVLVDGGNRRPDEGGNSNEKSGRIIIIGGWLGTGPLAASDTHVLDISFRSTPPQSGNGNGNGNGDHGNNNNGRRRQQQVLRWYQPAVKGTPPGPCNMHSADYVPKRRSVYVFRGGNGREYLNDLHGLHVDTLTWSRVETTGAAPQQRANHSSAVLDETDELFIFGGWNGGERLNDIHILDTVTSNWTCPRVGGVLPHPRAGMTLTALRGRLYLFGGSGTSAKCFQDLQILDRREMAWLDVTHYDDHHHDSHHHGGASRRSSHQQQQPHPFHHQGGDHDDSMLFRFGGGGGGSFGDQNNDGPVQYGDEHDDGGMNTGSQQAGVGGIVGGQEQQLRSHQPFASSRGADWRSRDMAARHQHHQQGGMGGMMGGSNYYPSYNSPNPNDEDTVPTVLVHGTGPGRRAGHTATAVNRKIYVFGGSCGSDYLNDFFVLDTDPPPRAVVAEPTSLQLLERRLRHFFNDEEFSDVTFVVQGRRVYGHKMVLSIVSDCFRAMFTTGFRESESTEIEIPDCSHAAFLAVMEYIYTGALPAMGDLSAVVRRQPHQNQQPLDHDRNLGRVVEMLELADRFFLDHLKQICETLLQPCVNAETLDYLLAVAQKTNATQLQAICEHFSRNREGLA